MPTHCTSLTGAQYYIILISCLMSDVTKADCRHADGQSVIQKKISYRLVTDLSVLQDVVY